MVQGAGYPVEKQYEALLLHYHWMVPSMGPPPSPEGTVAWPSLVNESGRPIEFSWRWNVRGKKPIIRYTIEGKDQFTGTVADPLNQDASRKLLYGLMRSFPGVDLTWTNHFLSTLFQHDDSKYIQDHDTKGTRTSSLLVAAELNPDRVAFKTYLVPQVPGLRPVPISFYKDAIAQVCPVSGACSALYDFLDGPCGQSFPTFFLGLDAAAPSESRLKVYLYSPHCSFKIIRQAMTLDGRRLVPAESIQELRSLVYAIAGVQPEFPEDREFPLANPEFSFRKAVPHPPCCFYFDIAPGRDLPNVKMFFSMSSFGRDDLSLARVITSWMDEHGKGGYGQSYLSVLECLAPRRRLDEGKGVHSWLGPQ
ncbi:hypothetical protein CDD80_5184 [Ophiocordyceps camponoti-rufipedis]|uniref:Aromatic prenyltransferase n=1 Tax=Ophiocordyceps camponoti-rufipedis TaxID=2004952 RepID=A0A2C5ZNJ1_9HYPO|nr:hypothetical protein CDD80_5184 [Ophiocordyceps camponoti-rufipedis]